MWDGDNARSCGKKRSERLFLVGHEEGPRGFGLRTGDQCNTAESAGDHRKPAQPSPTQPSMEY